MSVIMELITYFHDYIMLILSVILGLVSYIFLIVSTSRRLLDKFIVESHFLELVWTVLPMVLLLFMAFPSLYLLYLTEDSTNSFVVVKVVGHQWYWEYQYEGSGASKSFDSYMVGPSVLRGSFRNLDVDNRLSLPVYVSRLLLVGSADVLHSWTVPMLGVKVDAIPGRLNYLTVTPSQAGVFYGQCSELCGSNHSFMPIVVEASTPSGFIKFITS
jgi:cytochrome c oxidase subunit 2